MKKTSDIGSRSYAINWWLHRLHTKLGCTGYIPRIHMPTLCEVFLIRKLKKTVKPLNYLVSKSKYNNGLIAKLILMWRKEERREMIAWLLCKQQARYGCIGNGGLK